MDTPEVNQNTKLVQPEELKTLLTWKSPSRPFKRRDKEFFTTVAAIVFLIAVILLLLKEFLLIGVILSLMFIAYVLSTTEPEIVEHTITNRGIRSMGHDYEWIELGRFWFTEKWGQPVLTVALKTRALVQVIILVPKDLQDKVKAELQNYLVYQEKPEKNFFDTAAEWLSKKVPLENS
jgi:hypothetical protein